MREILTDFFAGRGYKLKMNITDNTVAICMATYNGAMYVKEQIESIEQQSYTNWILFIRDDNSTDDTGYIIKEKAKKNPEKIMVIEDDHLQGGSSKKNFAEILKWVSHNYDFNYFMFSDQDDYWLPQKVELSLNKVKKVEETYDGPVLIHTDLKVVDKNLNVIGESFIKYRALDPTTKDINHLLVQNNITGCTMCWNKKLNDILDISDDRVAMHDWWMALAATCFGKIEFIKEPTILYRQHGNNVVGATNVNSLSFIIKRLMGNAHVRETLNMSMVQARAFESYYRDELSKNQQTLVKEFSNLETKSKIEKIKTVLKRGYLKQGLVQIIGEIMFI